MQFASAEEAIQYLADEVGRLSARVYDLENKGFAQEHAFAVVLNLIAELPPLSADMVSHLLSDEAERMSELSTPDLNAKQRLKAIAERLREIADIRRRRPVFEVIEGGKSDPNST